MRRVCRVHVSEHQFRGGAREVVLEFRRDQRATAGLRVQLEHLSARSGAEGVAHPNGPDPSRYTRQRDVFDVEAAIEKEGKARTELLDRDSTRREHLRVSESVRERVSGWLHRSRAGFTDVITADRDRIPAGHFAGGEL